jgi:RNA polymerase sigma factor (sigma-70 family)
MSEDDSFRALVRRARQGDPDAARELFEGYEAHIRRIVRVRLSDPHIRRVMDSADVCQSVMANFFVRVATGQFDLDDPQDLIRLLVKMTQNKILDHVRKQHSDRRDRRREQGGPGALSSLTDRGESPSQIVANRELLEEARRRLSDEERYLADQRTLGREWTDLAEELGKSAEALRKQYARAIDRVTRELGLIETA